MIIAVFKMHVFHIFIFCFVCVNSVKKLPDFVEQCYKGDDKELSACVQRNIHFLRPRMAKGIPELLVPPMDPIIIPSAAIANENYLTCNLKNVNLYHANNFTVPKFDVDLTNNKWYAEMEYPSLGTVSQYHMTGKLLIFELNSSGEFRGNMTGIKIKQEVKVDVVKINGKEHFALKASILNLTIDYAHIEFDNLLGPENRELNIQANEIINKNYKVLLEEFNPVFAKMFDDFAQNVIGNLCKRYPIDVLYPKREKI